MLKNLSLSEPKYPKNLWCAYIFNTKQSFIYSQIGNSARHSGKETLLEKIGHSKAAIQILSLHSQIQYGSNLPPKYDAM